MKEYETDPVYMEALEWFVLIKDEKASVEDRRAFAEWIAADPAHAAAFERAETLWNRFDIVKPEYERLRKSGTIGRRGVLLGGLAALFVAPSAYFITRPGFFADFKTGIGERQSFTLPDGSTVELGSYSALSLDFTEDERRVHLYRGQGFFDVASNAARPFIVEAAKGATQARGTQFDVKALGEAVTVSVIENAVSVRLSARDSVEIGQGWQVSYDAAGLAAPRQVDIATIEAWRNDRIVFEDAPLRLVLRELERYRRGRILLMDDSIGDMPVTAIFNTRQAEDALNTISTTLPIRVADAGGFVAVVYRR